MKYRYAKKEQNLTKEEEGRVITSIAKVKDTRATARCKILLNHFEISKSVYYAYDQAKKYFDYTDYLMILKYFDKSSSKHVIRQLKMAIERGEGLI